MPWWIYYKQTALLTLTDGLETCRLLVDYCDVFISCLDFQSDGTHSLKRIHWWSSNAKLSKSVMIKKWILLHLEWLKGENILRAPVFLFGLTILLSSLLIAELKYLRLEIRTNPRPKCLSNFKSVLPLISYLKNIWRWAQKVQQCLDLYHVYLIQILLCFFIFFYLTFIEIFFYYQTFLSFRTRSSEATSHSVAGSDTLKAHHSQ